MRIVLAALLLLVFASSPVALAAPCGGFVDVDDSNPAHAPFCDSVEWMKNRAITFGLTPTLYDPNSFVTRLQMAAFMYRLGFENAFLHGGNAFESAGVGVTAILGTTNAQPLDIRVNNARVMRFEPHANGPNVIGGSPANNVTAGVGGVTIAGGFSNTASGYYGTVAGGSLNTASGTQSTVAGGSSNTASGFQSTVAAGGGNKASGLRSFAAGWLANANADGCFVWGDHSTNNEVECFAANRFVVRSLGGVFFLSAGNSNATYTGVELQPGGTAWVVASDRRIKENWRDIDTEDVLRRLLAVPITTWNLKAQDPSIRHMGPMAQDFRAAFDLGESELGINTLDADGVAFAAIQGLNAKLEAERAAKDAEIAALRAELAEIRSLLRSRSLH